MSSYVLSSANVLPCVITLRNQYSLAVDDDEGLDYCNRVIKYLHENATVPVDGDRIQVFGQDARYQIVLSRDDIILQTPRGTFKVSAP